MQDYDKLKNEVLIKIKEANQTIEKMEYSGCPHWQPSEHTDLFD